MTVSLKHKFTSAVADGGDANLVQPSNWNDEHDLVMATNKLLGRSTAGTGAAEEITIGTNLTLSGGTLDAAAYTDADALALFNASGSAPVYACRAWVNFNGTGTVAIRASGNVSSITDNGTGNYTVNFSTSMQTSDYAVGGVMSGGNNASDERFFIAYQFNTSSVQVGSTGSGGSANDAPNACVIVYE